MPSSTLPAASITPAASTAHLGIDIAQATFQAALLLPDGRLLDKASLPNTLAGFTQLRQWVDKHAVAMPVHAVMEATGTCYEELALHMHGRVTTLSVVNPRQIKAYADTPLRRAKTDAVDARLIARFACRTKARRLAAAHPGAARAAGAQPPPAEPHRHAHGGESAPELCAHRPCAREPGAASRGARR